MSLLAIENLRVDFGAFAAVKGIGFTIEKGETVGVVGESGSGKSVTALSILQLLPYPPASQSGSIRFDGQELVGAPETTLRKVRGARIAMIFQEPMTSLNPLHTIERQIGESLQLHKGLRGKAARARIIELLGLVGIPQPAERLGSYPHELSGGQRQRVMIAMALANEPDLLIADEPTTALDVTVQAQILDLLQDLQARFGMALLLITHDLGVVRKMASRVCVMRHGEIVEAGPVEGVFANPRHEYTKMLLAAAPKGQAVATNTSAAPLLACRDLQVHFPIKSGFLRRTTSTVKAVDSISLGVRAGQTLGVVGESGSGKTTLGLALLKLIDSQGEITFCGKAIQGFSNREMRAAAARDAGGVPGPVRLAQPAPQRGADRGGGAGRVRHRRQ